MNYSQSSTSLNDLREIDQDVDGPALGGIRRLVRDLIAVRARAHRERVLVPVHREQRDTGVDRLRMTESVINTPVGRLDFKEAGLPHRNSHEPQLWGRSGR